MTNFHCMRRVSIYSISHFIVDFACAFLMFRYLSDTPDWYLCLLVYNFCAFAMQMPLGVVADRLNKNAAYAAVGCMFVIVAYGLCSMPLGSQYTLAAVATALIAGIGNAMFHVGGGLDVLNISEKKAGLLGVFVSPGAFGIYFGTILGKATALPAICLPVALFVAAGAIWRLRRIEKADDNTVRLSQHPVIPALSQNQVATVHRIHRAHGQPQGEKIRGLARPAYDFPANADFSIDRGLFKGAFVAVACLFVVVVLRSFVGLKLTFPWKGEASWGIALICAVVFGKTLGGFAADRFGAVRVSAVSLGLSSLLFLLPNVPMAGVAAVGLFNMTMPITLWAMAKIFPNAKGFSFGLLTFGLFVGFLPVYFGMNVVSVTFLMFAVVAAVSLVLLCVGVKMALCHSARNEAPHDAILHGAKRSL